LEVTLFKHNALGNNLKTGLLEKALSNEGKKVFPLPSKANVSTQSLQ
jgi:hypothetical protein